MVFIYCKNCGHSIHQGQCNFEHYLGICNCVNYEESRIDNIRDLENQIQLVNNQDSAYRNKQIEGQSVNMEEWFRTHLKLRALEDRWFKHYGIMKYRDSEPI